MVHPARGRPHGSGELLSSSPRSVYHVLSLRSTTPLITLLIGCAGGLSTSTFDNEVDLACPGEVESRLFQKPRHYYVFLEFRSAGRAFLISERHSEPRAASSRERTAGAPDARPAVPLRDPAPKSARQSRLKKFSSQPQMKMFTVAKEREREGEEITCLLVEWINVVEWMPDAARACAGG